MSSGLWQDVALRCGVDGGHGNRRVRTGPSHFKAGDGRDQLLARERSVGLQLSHNAIVGEDEKEAEMELKLEEVEKEERKMNLKKRLKRWCHEEETVWGHQGG